MVEKRTRIFCACPGDKMSQVEDEISAVVEKRTEAKECSCSIGDLSKKQKLLTFKDMEVQIDGVVVL